MLRQLVAELVLLPSGRLCRREQRQGRFDVMKIVPKTKSRGKTWFDGYGAMQYKTVFANEVWRSARLHSLACVISLVCHGINQPDSPNKQTTTKTTIMHRAANRPPQLDWIANQEAYL